MPFYVWRRIALELSILGTLINPNVNANENVDCTALLCSRYLYYFAIIPIRSTCTMWPNYPVTEQVETAFKLRERLKNVPSCGHVLHKTLNLVISRCGLAAHGGEMYQNLFFSLNPIVL